MQIMKKRFNKKAISIIVSYVLLIVIVLSLAGGTYGFLKLYAQNPLPEEECPDGISIVLESYECKNNEITITLKNRGRHDVYFVAVNALDAEGNRTFLGDIPEDRGSIRGNEFPVRIPEPRTRQNIPYSGVIKSLEIIPFRQGKQARDFVCTEAIVKVPVENCGL